MATSRIEAEVTGAQHAERTARLRKTELMPCDFASRKATAQREERSEGGGARPGSPGRHGGKAGRGLASVLRDRGTGHCVGRGWPRGAVGKGRQEERRG
ncbi:unnamed protein product [Rangifer tarandus platyrhynchus]|uniref:Uncharacterized protein n=2 Tax=Rangifer tarandus platyrhynchus TaxID=3082113 RepID=A0ABN9A108_RANTA|nr:unnamed protein product [Rangifer tarandus platyrhynchus]CAI9711843.1 unnamed protein product [Rangifer tarandus platyrhynchus]